MSKRAISAELVEENKKLIHKEKKQIELKLPDYGNGYDELVINIVGNVDSGKSSLCGILSNMLLREELNSQSSRNIYETFPKLPNLHNILDDGNGLARSKVLALQHEQDSGRTSSISYNYMIFDHTEPRPRIVSLVDLAGHEAYLKTTITGVISSYPEHGLILIAKTITQMTREHYAILASMGIPILFVLTKTDIIPENNIKDTIKRIGVLSKRYGKTLMSITTPDDVKSCVSDEKTFGYIKLSNKSGEGIPLLIDYISQINHCKKKQNLIKGFAIDRIYYNITGFGLVVSGITGVEIKKGDSMFIGPFKGNEFVPVKIRSIHNDYRHFIDVLPAGIRGCLCIRLNDVYKHYLRMGMLICSKVSEINSVKNFEAYIAVFRGTSSNIRVGFNSYINIGLVKCGIRFNRIRDPETNIDIDCIKATKHTLVNISFMTHHNTINIGDRFFFRAGRCLGLGKVSSFSPV